MGSSSALSVAGIPPLSYTLLNRYFLTHVARKFPRSQLSSYALFTPDFLSAGRAIDGTQRISSGEDVRRLKQ